MFTMVFPCSTMVFWKVVTVNKHDSTIVLVLALAYIPQTHFHDIKKIMQASIKTRTTAAHGDLIPGRPQHTGFVSLCLL